MISLVALTDIQDLKYIVDSVKNNVAWPQFVSEAQQLDVKSQIGDALLNELITQYPVFSIENAILLNGGSYVYNTYTYLFQGLRTAIAYYAFARFTNRTPFNYTAAGITVKDSDLSTPATTKDIQRLETEARLTADAIMCEVILYLNRNYLLYPLWSDFGCGGLKCRDNRGIFKTIGD
jgi:hypothetical protein